MSIKIDVTLNHSGEKDEYPCLMLSKNSNNIILLTGLRNTATYKGDGPFAEGFNLITGVYSSVWDISNLEKFDGEITLRNED